MGLKITVEGITGLSKGVEGTIVVTLTDKIALGAQGEALDKATKGAIKKAIKTAGFEGGAGEALSLLAPQGVAYERIMLLGLGKEKDLKPLKAQSAGGKIVAALNAAKAKAATLVVEGVKDNTVAAHIAYGAQLRSYRFDQFKTKEKKEKKPTLTTLKVQGAEEKKAAALFKRLQAAAEGVFLARDVVTLPPNHLNPESYSKIICRELEPLGVKVKVLDVKEMKKLGMGALLGVGQGSANDSRLVVMEYKGTKNKEGPVAFVGKGVTFDTGGISIKPSAGMEDMKYDMGGSAAVVGAIKALATRKSKVHVVGVVGLVENMPDGNAQRPSDVVTSMSGQTIEVLNTDAEGRLVLADALWYCQENYKPRLIVDLATLTGAIVISLGDQYAGLFSNNDALSEQLFKTGEAVGERLWRFPLREEYDKMLDSPIADMQNISNGRGAGSITAAQFLKRFIKGNTPWAHLDIAGMAWAKKDQDTCPQGAVGFGVRLLDKLVEEYYE